MPQADVDVPFKYGNRSQFILQLQTFLGELGYPVELDGIVGQGTQDAVNDAISKLQNSRSPVARQIAAGGIPTQATGWSILALLQRGVAASRDFLQFMPQPATPVPLEPVKTIRMGPRDAASFGRSIGIGSPAFSTSSLVLGGAGLLALGIGAALTYRSSRA